MWANVLESVNSFSLLYLREKWLLLDLSLSKSGRINQEKDLNISRCLINISRFSYEAVYFLQAAMSVAQT